MQEELTTIVDDENIRIVSKDDYKEIHIITLNFEAHSMQFGVVLDVLWRHQNIYEALQQYLDQNRDITNHLEYMQSQGINIPLLRQIDYASEDGQFIRGIAQSYIVHVYTLWEEVYRSEIASIIGIKKCEVKSDLMGDFRLLRHNILHHRIDETYKIPDNLTILKEYWQEESQEPIVSNLIKIPIRLLLSRVSNFRITDIQPKLGYMMTINGVDQPVFPQPHVTNY